MSTESSDPVESHTESEVTRRLNDALERVAHGATVSIPTILFQRLVTFGLTAVLTSGFAAAAYGLYALARRFQRVPRSLASGFMSGFPRYVPTADDDRERDLTITFGSVLLLVIASVFGAALTLSAPTLAALTDKGSQFVRLLELLGLGLPAGVWLSTVGSLLRSFEEVTAMNLGTRVIAPLGTLSAVVVGTVVFGSLLAVVVGTIVVEAVVGVAIVGWLFRRHGVRPRLRDTQTVAVAKQFLTYTAPLFLTGFAYTTQQLGFYPLLAWFLPAAAGGVFVISVLLAEFVRLPLKGLNQFVSPVIATLHDDGHYEALDRLYKVTTRLVLVVATAVVVPAVVYRRELLAFFDPAYVTYAPFLPLFLAAQYAASAAGCVAFLLIMTDHERASLVINSSVTLVLALAAVPLTVRYGFAGVVWLYLAMNVLNNVGEMIGLYYLEGFQPFTTRLFVPLVAAVLLAGVSVVTRRFLPTLPGAVLGVVVGVTAYALVLRAFGFSDVERTLAATIAERYRSELKEILII